MPDFDWLQPSSDPFAPQTRVDLAPMTPVESRLLATDILSPLSPLPMRLVDLVVAEAAGNPLYIVELIRHFLDTGIIQQGGRWSVDMAAAEAVRLPRTLRQMLRMRLDNLPEAERLALGQASVMGDVFWDRGLSLLRPLGEDDPDDRLLDGTLAGLAAKELIRPAPSLAFGETVAYRFSRPLLRDVAYDSLYAPQRRQAHRQIAAWLLEWREQGKLGEWFSPAGMLAWAAGQQEGNSFRGGDEL
jgi:adenylate cyclase